MDLHLKQDTMDPRLRNHRERQMLQAMMKADKDPRFDFSGGRTPDAATIGFIQRVSASILGIDDLDDTEALLRIVLDLAEKLVRKRQTQRMVAENARLPTKATSTLSLETSLREQVTALEDEVHREAQARAGPSHADRVEYALSSLESMMHGGPTPTSPSPSDEGEPVGVHVDEAEHETIRSKLERLRDIAKEFQV